jgi:hypothetical protein
VTTEPDPIAAFCAELREAQEDAKIPVVQLARRLKISKSQIYAIRNGQLRRPPSWDLVQRWIEICAGDEDSRGRVRSMRQRYQRLLVIHDYHKRRPAEPEPSPPANRTGAGAVDRDGTEPVDPLAGLASMVRQTWEREERHRGLHYPDPLPLSWYTVGPPLGDGWSAVRTDKVDQPLDLDGTYEQLYDVLRDERHHGRVVLLGEPGAGKTALLLRLTLCALDDPSAAGRVPVLLRLSSWDPHEQTFQQWVKHRLTEDYGWAGRQSAGRPAVPVDRLLPILDGFDEMPEHRRGDAIIAINRALGRTSPLVLSSRTEEYRAAVDTGPGAVLFRAAVLKLEPLDPDAAYRYLRAATPPRRRDRWNELIDRAGTDRGAIVAAALRTPLAVSLARVAYADHDRDPRELLALPTTEAVQQHLFNQFVPATYLEPPDPGPGRGRWRRRDAHQYLHFLAQHLRRLDKHEIAWWELIHAIPRGIRRLAFGLTMAFASMPLYWLMGGPLVGAMLALLSGLVGAFALSKPTAPRPGRITLRRTAEPLRGRLLRGLTLTLFGGLAGLLGDWLGNGLVFIQEDEPAWDGLFFGLVTGAIFGLAFGVVGEFATTQHHSPSDPDPRSVPTPRVLLRRDRNASLLAGLVAGLAGGLTVGVIITSSYPPEEWVAGLWPGLIPGLVSGLLSGFVVAMAGAWAYFVIARVWLALIRRLPWNLLAFLDDAYDKGALRRFGAVYQFRHDILRDRLAADLNIDGLGVRSGTGDVVSAFARESPESG